MPIAFKRACACVCHVPYPSVDNDKEDETVHLRKVIHHLRHQNLELETLLLNTRQRLELATSATSTSLVVPDRSEVSVTCCSNSVEKHV